MGVFMASCHSEVSRIKGVGYAKEIKPPIIKY